MFGKGTHEFRSVDHWRNDIFWAANTLIELSSKELLALRGLGCGDLLVLWWRAWFGCHFEEVLPGKLSG